MMHDPFTALIAFLAPSYVLALVCVCGWALRNPPDKQGVYHLSEQQVVDDGQ